MADAGIPDGAPGRPNLIVSVHFRDGTTRAVRYDCNEESPFQALERVYRCGDADGPDFWVWDVSHVTFDHAPRVDELDPPQSGGDH